MGEYMTGQNNYLFPEVAKLQAICSIFQQGSADWDRDRKDRRTGTAQLPNFFHSCYFYYKRAVTFVKSTKYNISNKLLSIMWQNFWSLNLSRVKYTSFQ